jgi:NitT/TauT family transport system ATP-binding protein
MATVLQRHEPLEAATALAAPTAVSLRGVTKTFGHGGDAVTALDRVSLDIAEREFVCLVGASGCGKSTLLSIIAGLDRASSGTVDVRGGRAALMFQEPALLPWLTVESNVELPMKLQGVPAKERRARVAELIELVHLTSFARSRPHQLSGGMRQRVALARALAQRASVLLMDEPFASLDAITRDVLHDELTRIWREREITVVFVTHNVREAVRLGDRVVLLSARPGRVVSDYRVEIPRPRAIETPAVGTMSLEITDHLRGQIRRHGNR